MNVIRDLSLILLACEAFAMALAPLVLLGAAVYGVWRLRRHENLPTWLQLAQAYLSLGRGYVELAMQALVRPILMVHSALAQVQGLLGAIAKPGGNE